MVVVNIVDTLTYFYIKRIKRGMQCPVCNQKLIFSKSKASWCCNNCDYSLQENDFYDDYVFMFCDECNAYLNNQEGFDKNATKHICRECGYENDTTFDNIKGSCIDCGTIIENPDGYLCADCKKQIKEKAEKWLIKACKAIGVTALLIGGTYFALRLSDNEDEFENWIKNASSDELSEAYQYERQEWIKNGYNNGTGEKTAIMNRLNKEISKRVAEEWEDNPNRNRDPNYRWFDEARWDDD